MRRRLASASPVDRAAPTDDPVAAGRGGARLAGLLLAAGLATAPALAQTRDDLADPNWDTMRRTPLRTTIPGSTLARSPARAPALRGSLDPTSDGSPADPFADVSPPPPPTGGDRLGEADAVPAEAAPPRTPPLVRIAPQAPTTAATAPEATAPRPADGTTGRPAPRAADATGTVPIASVRPAGPAKEAGRVLPRPATEPTPRDAGADQRDEAAVQDEAYAPLGLRSGGFTWLPALETSLGWSSNVASKSGGAAGTTYRVAPELLGRSDWSRHALEFELRGAYLGNTADHAYDKPSVQAAVRGRIDFGDETRVDVKAGYARDRQSPSTTDDPTNTAVPATVESKTGSVGLTRDVGLLALTLRGDVERTAYSGGTTTSGAPLGSEVQNNTRWIGAFRTTWGSKGTLRPFAELQLSKRDYDATLVSGDPRDSTGGAIKAGVVADLGPKLRGELSTGWGVERPDKGPLPDMSGWLLDGSLVWSPTRLTVVRLDARTGFEPTTLAGAAGAVGRTVGVAVDYALRRDLVATNGVTFTDKRYVGVSQRETDLVLSSGLTYKFDRDVWTYVRTTLERFTSTAAGSGYDAATVMVGVRLQR